MPRTLIIALRLIGLLIAAIFISSLFNPQLLLFPYVRMIGQTTVYSDVPIPDAAAAVIDSADALVSRSALFEPGVLTHPVFLTDGGWRWHVLSFQTLKAFAQTRPLSRAIVVNRSNLARDKVWAGPAGERDLSAVIAHERTHALIRAKFGILADRSYPRWVVEGYCDHVAGSSTLSDEAAATLVAEDRRTPALFYYQSRKRVEAVLQENGGSVEQMFSSAER
ncbi:hypothetical protein [uncultured Brevundimonas sp.]|uniref:hypothetical protein n=1 Tax=uncultured Brevundimonas sp. TaxID=213418 RepID=UPI0030EED9AB|tara:strand:+ start:5049 stop:5714 length:666 start_codon:yes stop_codon:yes gene_type:complete